MSERWPDETARNERCAYFVQITMHRPRRCDGCAVLLPRGASARMGVETQTRVRHVLCSRCGAGGMAFRVRPRAGEAGDGPSLLAVSATSGLDALVPPRGSIAVWVAVGVLGACAALGSRTGRRLLATTWVGLKALVLGLAARARGRKNVAPTALRHAFEELGPTYIKLGQLVASSHGLFPERYCQEFRKCFDRVRPFPFEDVQRILRAELGRDPQDIFTSVDREPLASASIAQVHAARLRDGQEVVIKVQRPKIAQIVESDLRVLRLGARAMALVPHGELANPVGIVEDFESNIREELDFRLEAASMEEFNRIMAEHGQSQVAAPRVIAEWSTKRVLVMERFFGHRVDDVENFRASNVDAEAKLLVGMRAWFQCMILHGFFHGDVHAGNLMALDDGRVGFLDFGIVGRFPHERREQVTEYLMAFATGDFRKLAEVMVAMGSVDRAAVNLDQLGKDLAEAYEPMLSSGLAAVTYADIIPTILRTGVQHGMRMPREFVLVVKQMLYFDRYAKLLAPGLNVFRDPRIVSGLMADVMQARQRKMARGAESPSNIRPELALF
jgi:aarF domain-containing kinase